MFPTLQGFLSTVCVYSDAVGTSTNLSTGPPRPPAPAGTVSWLLLVSGRGERVNTHKGESESRGSVLLSTAAKLRVVAERDLRKTHTSHVRTYTQRGNATSTLLEPKLILQHLCHVVNRSLLGKKCRFIVTRHHVTPTKEPMFLNWAVRAKFSLSCRYSVKAASTGKLRPPGDNVS